MTVPETAGQQCVLIVEDEALIADEIRERLTRQGYHVAEVCDTAEQAIQAAERHSPHIVLMDIRLKGPMDGIEAGGHIYQNLDIPIVYLTAHSDQATLQRAKASAPFGYVLKPFQERDLLIALEMATHRHRLEQRLKESEQRYAATLASVGDAVIATDPEGRVSFMNRVALSLTQWSLADAQGRPIDEVFPVLNEATREPREHPTREAIRLQKTVTLTEPALIVARDGTLIPIDDCAAPITSDQGRVLGAVVAFRDIRQRRLAEEALKQAEENLHQAQKMEAVGRLAAGIAHDFNNLLTIINGYSELLLSGGHVNAISRDLLKEVRQAGERAAGLTRQMLAFGRKQLMQPVSLHLGRFVDQMVANLERTVGDHIAVKTSAASGLDAVSADPQQLEQVILALAINARDAMSRGGRLSLDASNVEFTKEDVQSMPEIPPGRYVLLAVSDTGVGMDAATQDRVFEPFFTTKTLGQGMGLGLATVYGTIKQSGGFIDVVSEVGKGTTFKLLFPALGPEASDSALPLPKEKTPERGSETILFVEDDDAVRTLASAALRRYGYTILEAHSGEEALRLFAERVEAIRLVMTDVTMPLMSGPEVVARIQAIKPEMRVLYLSGYTDDLALKQDIVHGAVAFLQKPFTLVALAQKVREVLDG